MPVIGFESEGVLDRNNDTGGIQLALRSIGFAPVMNDMSTDPTVDPVSC
jgi:hypothetical protein